CALPIMQIAFVMGPILVTNSHSRMKTFQSFLSLCCWAASIMAEAGLPFASAADVSSLDVGIAIRDVTPEGPIWLAGYAARKKPADKIDQPLLVQALALKNISGERLVFVSLDNCEVSHDFTAPVVRQNEEQHRLRHGSVMIISSHTHSAPVLDNTLDVMYELNEVDRERVRKYSDLLRAKLVEVVGAARSEEHTSELQS